MENNKIIKLLFLLLILSYVFFLHDDFSSAYKKILNKINPCPTPITYSIGEFDNQFNISEEDFKSAIKEAEDLWEKASGRNLFEYSKNGEMKINLVYDNRQDSTSKLNNLDNNLKQDNNYYLQLKSQYELLVSQYNQKNQELSTLTSSYNQKLSVYENAVNLWNKKNGSQNEYNQLLQQKQELDNLASTIKNKQSDTTNTASRINQLAQQLNTLAGNLNLNIAKYNNVVESTDQEFEEGNYVSGPNSKEINIYQFQDRDKLVRVLTHELGHALGIDHINNSEDVMYSQNIGNNKNITEADLTELNKVCPR
jgi:predicted Zn-dependent protease